MTTVRAHPRKGTRGVRGHVRRVREIVGQHPNGQYVFTYDDLGKFKGARIAYDVRREGGTTTKLVIGAEGGAIVIPLNKAMRERLARQALMPAEA